MRVWVHRVRCIRRYFRDQVNRSKFIREGNDWLGLKALINKRAAELVSSGARIKLRP